MPSLLEATHRNTDQQDSGKNEVAHDPETTRKHSKVVSHKFPIGNRKECNGNLCARHVIQIRTHIHCVLPSAIVSREQAWDPGRQPGTKVGTRGAKSEYETDLVAAIASAGLRGRIDIS